MCKKADKTDQNWLGPNIIFSEVEKHENWTRNPKRNSVSKKSRQHPENHTRDHIVSAAGWSYKNIHCAFCKHIMKISKIREIHATFPVFFNGFNYFFYGCYRCALCDITETARDDGSLAWLLDCELSLATQGVVFEGGVVFLAHYDSASALLVSTTTLNQWFNSILILAPDHTRSNKIIPGAARFYIVITSSPDSPSCLTISWTGIIETNLQLTTSLALVGLNEHAKSAAYQLECISPDHMRNWISF